MKKIIASLLLVAASTAYGYGFLTGETVSGTKRICYYDTVSGEIAITIAATDICSPTIAD